MFFYLSKILWFFAQPTTVLIFLVLLGAVLLATRLSRLGRRLIVTAAIGLLVAGFSPLSDALFLPLENRFPRPELDNPPDGIVILGGSLDIETGAVRGTVEMNESAERLFEAIALARRFPDARIVFSGGSNKIFASGTSEAAMARDLFTAVGLDPARLAFEGEARNTAQNAILTKALVNPLPGQHWLLVTSAFHIPRAIGCFRKVGWDIEAWPVDYRTAGPGDSVRFHNSPADGLKRTEKALREWIGLVAYRLTDRTDALFPAPRN
ncbi:MAG: YdcF family protein [Hyphomicrobiales bacterium]|nr:YdcF family protein [Hyphomicrobiales bacterium]